MSDLMQFNRTITNPKTQEYLQNVLSEKKNSFVNNITALVSSNQKLQECEPLSLMYAGIKATALDLPLDANLGFAYVIPFRNNRENKVEAQFQMGYKGFIQLAIRSGQFKTINVTEVKEGELIEWDMLSGEVVFQAKPNREELKTIGYAAYFRLTNGFEKTLYSTNDTIERHAKRYSQTYSSSNQYVQKSSKWNTDFEAMAKKTVLKLLLSRFAPLSVEMQSAIINDQSIITERGNKYVDNDTDIIVAEEIENNGNKEAITAFEEQEIQTTTEEEKDVPSQEKAPIKAVKLETPTIFS